MRQFTILFTIFQLTSFLVAAHPFVIVHTKVTRTQVYAPQPTHHYERRDILSDLQSAADSLLGIDDETTSTKATATKTSSTKATVTLVPPMTASATTSSEEAESTSTDDDDDEDEDESTTSTEESSTTESETSTTTESSTSSEVTSTSSDPATSATAVPSPTLGNVQATATAEASTKDDDGSGVPPGGIAVAVIMSLLIVAVTAWLIFKYHPKSQAWWAARQEKRFQERSYRDALDNPNAGSPSLRQQALSGNASKRQTLKSFFVPATAKLGQGKEIKRKPVNWGVESPRVGGTADTEKVPMTAAAAPMGQIERFSVLPQAQATSASAPAAQPVSPVSLHPKQSLEQLPPISPLSTHRELPPISGATAERDLPALPPVPNLPNLIHAKRGSDGVFRLA